MVPLLYGSWGGVGTTKASLFNALVKVSLKSNESHTYLAGVSAAMGLPKSQLSLADTCEI